jgi:PAS domain S-box-containing protein
MAAAVSRCSRDLRYVWVSRGYAAWMGRPMEEIAGRPIRNIIGAEGYEQIRPYIEQVLSGRRVEYTTQVNFLGPGKQWIHAVYVPTYSHGEEADGWIAVVTDITEMLRDQGRLREVNASLTRANEDLERFAFVASHDLKEPLRMITTYAQLLIKSYPDRFDREAGMFVGNIIEGTERIRELLADLLAYTAIGSHAEEPVDAVDLNLIFDHIKQNLKASIDETGAIVTSDILPTLRAYAAHFTSLFQNLIGNAIKYRAQQPPQVHISVRETNGQLRFAVADNGIGIDPEYHEQIFEVFKRLHGKKIPGTGMGLAICQRVVERYDGRIWVESQVGHGATFFFTMQSSVAVDAGVENL